MEQLEFLRFYDPIWVVSRFFRVIYLIGGPSRSGKSTLASRVRKHIDGQVLSADAFLASLHAVLKPEWEPDIFIDVINPINDRQSDGANVKRGRERDKVMWQFFVGYLKEAERISNDDVLLDGMLWPDFIAAFPLRHKAVFLVDTSPGQAERLIKIRDSGGSDNNWMGEHRYSDDKIRGWVSFNIARSNLYIELCKKHNYQYFDIADAGMQVAETRAFEYLLSKKV